MYVFVYWLSHIRYHSITRTLSLEVSTNTHIDCTLNISSIRFICRPILIVPSVFLLYGCVCQLGIKENNDDDDDDDDDNAIQFNVKNANGTAVTLQSAMGKNRKTDKS